MIDLGAIVVSVIDGLEQVGFVRAFLPGPEFYVVEFDDAGMRYMLRSELEVLS